ncbi:MAG TPA: flavin reductase family protein [Alphaproteobacteria bacterium]|nr:flavin reductase family protein [Alphaproteobacteria bacterium]
MTLSQREFRTAIGHFATGVAVIAAQVGDEVHAMTANAVSSLSLDPMLILFCPSKGARFAQFLPELTTFSINILREEQQALSNFFAGAWRDTQAPAFRFVRTAAGPRLEGALASLNCELLETLEGGDHLVVIGRVTATHIGTSPRQPLIFFKGQYRSMSLAEESPAPDLANVNDEPAHIFYMGTQR